MHAGYQKKTWVRTAILILAAVLLLVFLYRYNYLHYLSVTMAYHFNLYHSKCLPYPSENFVGRDMEMTDVVQLVDFTNSDTRIVSIVGSPGFGKSTLAIHVGHHMVDQGVVVHYVNMIEVPHMTVLAEKVLDCAEISVKKVSFERLLKWGRGLYHDTLLILDNCDNIFHHSKELFQNQVEELVTSSRHIKVLMTSREVVIHLEQFRLYRVHELTTTAACELMGQVTKDLTFLQKETIANLTGNVPLALHIVASLLNLPDPPSPATIISELRDELIPTLSPQELPRSKQVNSSITLSYRYLSLKMQKIGRYLANFPGSFDLEAAYGVLWNIDQNVTPKYVTTSIEKLTRQSLLEHSQRFNRYQFHRLIQEYFVVIQDSIGENGTKETRRFAVSFEWYYAQMLNELTQHFSINHVKALAKLDTERHNIQFLLYLCEVSLNINLEVHNNAIRCILFAIHEHFLQRRFTDNELYGPINGITTYCDKNFKSISRRYPDSINAYYVAFIVELARIEDILHGTSSAIEVFVSRKQFIESMASRVTGKSGSPAYRKFYYSLSDYYNRVGDHINAKECNEKVLRATQQLSECDPGLCDYQSIANAYSGIGEYEKAIHFYELALEHQHLKAIDRGFILVRISVTYISKKDIRTANILGMLLDLFPSLMAAPASEFCDNVKIDSIILLYTRLGCANKANVLREKQLKALHEIGQKLDINLVVEVQYLAEAVFERERNYSRAVDLAELAFKFWVWDDSESGKKINKIKVQLWLLIGKAKYLHGNYSEGLDYIQRAVDLIYSGNGTSTFAEELLQACPYIIYRGKVRCLVDLTIGGAVFIGNTVIRGIFSNVLEVDLDTLLPDPPKVISAQMTRLSTSRELAMPDTHDVSSWSTISSSGRSLLKLIFTTIMRVVRVTISTPIGIKLTRTTAKGIIVSFNVVGVFIKFCLVICLTHLCFRLVICLTHLCLVICQLACNAIVKVAEISGLTTCINFCMYYVYVLYILVVVQFV